MNEKNKIKINQFVRHCVSINTQPHEDKHIEQQKKNCSTHHKYSVPHSIHKRSVVYCDQNKKKLVKKEKVSIFVIKDL